MLLPFRFGFDATQILETIKETIKQLKDDIMSEIDDLKAALAAQGEAIQTEIVQINDLIADLQAKIEEGQVDKQEIIAITEQLKAQTAVIEGIVVPEVPPEEPPVEPEPPVEGGDQIL